MATLENTAKNVAKNVVQIEIPNNLPEEERALLERIHAGELIEDMNDMTPRYRRGCWRKR